MVAKTNKFPPPPNPSRARKQSTEASTPIEPDYREKHPLDLIFEDAVLQATKGKGERHGGDATPFYDQKWVRLAETHGNGFLTGQAVKKVEEAVEKAGRDEVYGLEDSEAFEREILGAIVYLSMALLQRRGYPKPFDQAE